MNERISFWDKVIVGADLATEALPGVPLVEIMSDCRVLIENHKGVTAYGCNEIRVRVKYGVIAVLGDALELACMTKQRIVIIGKIDGINVERGQCK